MNGLTWSFHFQFGDTALEYLGHVSVSRSWVQGQGHGSEKAVACNSITTGRKLLGLDWNVCYDNAASNSELLTVITFHRGGWMPLSASRIMRPQSIGISALPVT